MSDPREYLREPHNTADGAIATDGAIIICVPGLAVPPNRLAKKYPCAAAYIEKAKTTDYTNCIRVADIELPPPVICLACKGSKKSIQCCGTCDGDGYFNHRGFEYECLECSHVNGNLIKCPTCQGTGTSTCIVDILGSKLYGVDERYIRLIRDLVPDAVIVALGGDRAAFMEPLNKSLFERTDSSHRF